MSGIATAVVGGAVISSYASSKASDKASKAAGKAAGQATGAELEMFYEGQRQTAPWRETGKEALGALGDIYGIRTPSMIDQETGEVSEWRDPSYSRAMDRFQTSPGYQFQMDESMKAANYMSPGMTASGPQARRLQEIAQGTANMEFGKYTQGLQSLAGVGMSSAESGANRGMSVGQSVGQNYMSAGAASAQDYINQSNVMSNMIGQGAKAFGMYQGANQPTDVYSYGGGTSPYGLPGSMPADTMGYSSTGTGALAIA